ncbi:class E sortase [Streptomyces sp. NPDC029004]|uniref:class E sortase n=1 Tax=Streptomyces sp. NPDC029004 TaxID=3154490 RepID=UPI0033DDAD8F
MGKVLRLLGIVLILAGVSLGGFKVAQSRQADDTYSDTQQALQEEFQKSKKPRPHEGHALAVLRIPRFGAGYAQVVLQGTSRKTLEKGPGHFPGTAMPGEIGNFAIAGHRTGWGQPFHRLPELKRGDAIKVEWHGSEYTYRVTRTKVVKPSDVGVVLPVPNKPDGRADKARITLTTCTDRGSNGTYLHRLVAWGELDER